MKKINKNIFTITYPRLDLHGETYDTCLAPINSFINDNIRLKNPKLIIIHGISGGILKARVHEILKQHRSVEEYQLDSWNLGETIITIKLDKK